MEYIEIQSDLFRESGVNASTSPEKISEFAEIMNLSGWDAFQPISGVIQEVTLDDVESYQEAVEHGYEHELAWSRPLTIDDIGLDFVAIEDGHNRAYAAREVGIPIRVRIWKSVKGSRKNRRRNPVDLSLAVVLQPGTILYHGTAEEFDSKDLRPGGYDGVLWFADNPAIAQTYIPVSGVSVYAGPEALQRPVSYPNDQHLVTLQRAIGIDYEYDTPRAPEYDAIGRVKSFYNPKGWDHLPEVEEIEERLEQLGYTREHRWQPYEFKFHNGKLLKGDEYAWGRLFIATVQEPLVLYDNTMGGEREGDLMNVEYHNIPLFRLAEREGYDGIKINDFAQSKAWGNFGHYSYGVFKNSIPKLTWVTLPAQHWDWETWEELHSGTTPHIEKWHKEQASGQRRRK